MTGPTTSTGKVSSTSRGVTSLPHRPSLKGKGQEVNVVSRVLGNLFVNLFSIAFKRSTPFSVCRRLNFSIRLEFLAFGFLQVRLV